MNYSPLEIYAFSQPSWEQYKEILTNDNSYDNSLIENEELYEEIHHRVLNENYAKISNNVLNESTGYSIIHPHDKVKYKDQIGFITGAIGGKYVVQIQHASYIATADELTLLDKDASKVNPVLMKFDKQTQKLLENQNVKCGIYERNVPVKLNCYVNYSEYLQSPDNSNLYVIIENSQVIMPKNSIKILENVQELLNPENYIQGVIVNDAGEAILNVLVNSIDYVNVIGGSDQVRVIIQNDQGVQELQYFPANKVKTLAV